ncbi:M48 family metalloprotease [Marinomonas algicola]|uniref:M48 family metalloprotease n=1 Tax=Marinomonas algicola TaxID=2773454 RepID=UPI00174E28E0|nr:M48 family metalloprotease [Marinomonas algicola]
MPSLQKSLSERSLDNPSYVIGQYWFRQLNGSQQLINFPPAYDYLSESLGRLLLYTNLSDKHVEIGILNSTTSNAFVMPGNHLFLYSDIIKLLDSEDKFFALLAHEAAHLDAKHYERQQQNALQEQKKMLALIGTSIALALAGSDSEAGSALWLGGMANHSENALSYSRAQEQEADRIGKSYLAKAGIGSSAMNELFLSFSKASPRGEQLEFLSTHPVPQNRASDSLNSIEPVSIMFKHESEYFQYFRATLLVYRSLLTESINHSFLTHPNPRIKRYIDILSFWLRDIKTAPEMVEKLNENNEFEAYLKAQIYISSKQIDKATNLIHKKLALDPDNATYTTLLASTTFKPEHSAPKTKPYQYQRNQSLDTRINIAKHNQNLPLTLTYLAQKSFDQGKADEALTHLNRAKKLANTQERQLIASTLDNINTIIEAQKSLNLPPK